MHLRILLGLKLGIVLAFVESMVRVGLGLNSSAFSVLGLGLGLGLECI